MMLVAAPYESHVPSLRLRAAAQAYMTALEGEAAALQASSSALPPAAAAPTGSVLLPSLLQAPPGGEPPAAEAGRVSPHPQLRPRSP
eukprot:SM007203S21253  [mRNA]  locus=s7203:9:353:- [translate_table: standard]